MPRVHLYGPRGSVQSHHIFLPLKPLVFSLYTGEGTVRLLSTTRGQVEKVKPYKYRIQFDQGTLMGSPKHQRQTT